MLGDEAAAFNMLERFEAYDPLKGKVSKEKKPEFKPRNVVI